MKGIRKTDYEKIAAWVCHQFGFKSVYQYKTLCNGKHCDARNCDRSNPGCVAYPRGRWHPAKWKPYQVIEERELFFNETLLN